MCGRGLACDPQCVYPCQTALSWPLVSSRAGQGPGRAIGTLWGAWLVGWALFSQQELGNLLEGEGRATGSHVSVPVIGRD